MAWAFLRGHSAFRGPHCFSYGKGVTEGTVKREYVFMCVQAACACGVRVRGGCVYPSCECEYDDSILTILSHTELLEIYN